MGMGGSRGGAKVEVRVGRKWSCTPVVFHQVMAFSLIRFVIVVSR